MKILNSMKVVCGITIAATFTLTTPAYSGVDAGKAIFNKSCIGCHGEAGMGNGAQDQFWKVKIPRLNGAYVQKKTDAQLKDVILNGIRKMPSGVQGTPHADKRTRVMPEDVPDLIDYVRSLKKR